MNRELRDKIVTALEPHGFQPYRRLDHSRNTKAGRGMCSGDYCMNHPIIEKEQADGRIFAFCLFHLLRLGKTNRDGPHTQAVKEAVEVIENFQTDE